MKKFDVLAFLDEAKRLTALSFAAAAVTGVVLMLDRAGGPLSAILGMLAAAFAGRLLQQASMRPASVQATSEGSGDTSPSADMSEVLQDDEQPETQKKTRGPATEPGEVSMPPVEKNLFRPL